MPKRDSPPELLLPFRPIDWRRHRPIGSSRRRYLSHMEQAYDRIGVGYAARRRPDPRIASMIERALGDARSIVSVGAGTGSYEPAGARLVTAVEPSTVMISQRPPGSAPVVRAVAENLPFRANAFDAALAVLTVHHWSDVHFGLEEMRRVAHRHVILTFDPEAHSRHWLVDYVPELKAIFAASPPVEELARLIGARSVKVILLRHDTPDGMTVAYWRLPHAYLDPSIRAAGSAFHQVEPDALRRGLDRLEKDLASGEWQARYGHLMALEEMDVGMRLLTS